jgi:hypothetical protein
MAASAFSGSARLVRACAVLSSTLFLLSLTAGAAAAETQTTSSVLAAAKSAIGKQTGVHLVVTSSATKTLVGEDLRADLGKTSGVETISEASDTVVIKIVPTYAYLSGNSAGLTKILGMTSAEAKVVGKHWVAVKAGTSQYKNLAESVTISSVTSVLPPAKGTQLYAPATGAKDFYTLKWATAATSSTLALTNTLTISAVGAPLPVQETSTAAGGAKQTVALSKWGEHVLVSAPPAGSTIPLSKVTG